MEEKIKPLKKSLDDHERRISRLEKLVTKQPRKKKKVAGGGGKRQAKRKKAISASGRPGPGAMIDQLIEKNFFKKHRVLNDIIKHCKNNLAHKYKANEFSTPLARAIRNEKLKREKNKDGQFEYYT